MRPQLLEDIFQAHRAFELKDKEYSESEDIETTGHPFTICTNICKWLIENYFPDGKIMGYNHDENPTASLGKNEGGHDFVVVDNIIIDFWPQAIGISMPFLAINIVERAEVVSVYYGDPATWVEVK